MLTYILRNGTKAWITNSNEAGLFIIFANVDASQGYRGITAFIVTKDLKGVSIGKKEDKLGIRASSTCEVILDDCVIPAENVLGQVGKGYKYAIETLNEGRIGIAAQMIGIAQVRESPCNCFSFDLFITIGSTRRYCTLFESAEAIR
jgi:alkylation response protein AidB-like acyl-CoA dehydrogenase